MTELHLFVGAGGGILGGLLLGHVPVCAVEIDPYCQEVLRARQRDGMLPDFPIYDDVRTFDGTPWAGRVDCIAGGFPCQDISVAGKGAGIDGERSGLWRHMARIVGEIRPRYVFVENSPALVGRGLAVVLGDLAALGYDARWTVLGAHHVGAPHRRGRIWILAEPNGQRREPCDGRRAVPDSDRDCESALWATQRSARPGGTSALANPTGTPGESGARRLAGDGSGLAVGGEALWPEAVADAERAERRAFGEARGEARPELLPQSEEGSARARSGGQDVPNRNGARLAEWAMLGCDDGAEQQAAQRGDRTRHGASDGLAEPRLGRGPNGLARWVDRSTRGYWRGGRWERGIRRLETGVPNRSGRLRAIGNGQVPQCAAVAWRELMSWEVPA